MGRPPDKSGVLKNYFLYFLSKTYVFGIQKNRLNETVLLSTQNTCLNWWVRKKLQFYPHKIFVSGSMKWVRKLSQFYAKTLLNWSMYLSWIKSWKFFLQEKKSKEKSHDENRERSRDREKGKEKGDKEKDKEDRHKDREDRHKEKDREDRHRDRDREREGRHKSGRSRVRILWFIVLNKMLLSRNFPNTLNIVERQINHLTNTIVTYAILYIVLLL